MGAPGYPEFIKQVAPAEVSPADVALGKASVSAAE
jgi:hypothetical protein